MNFNVQGFRYPDVAVTAGEGLGTGFVHRISERNKILGAMRGMWKNRAASRQEKVGMF